MPGTLQSRVAAALAVVEAVEVGVRRHLPMRRLPALLQSVRPQALVLVAVEESGEAVRCRARTSYPIRPHCMARPPMGLIPWWNFLRRMAQTCRQKMPTAERLSISLAAAVVAVVAAQQPQMHFRKP